MAAYELVREIYNKCPGNQGRDTFISEIETDDVDEYVSRLLGENDVITDRDVLPDGSYRFDVNACGLLQRYSFTEL